MADKEHVLSELTLDEWLDSVRRRTEPARGKRGPLDPHAGGVRDVVPGPYVDWHYTDLPLLRVLETIVEQKERIASLEEAIGAVLTCLARAGLNGAVPFVEDAERLGMEPTVGEAGIPRKAADILRKYGKLASKLER